MEISARYAHAVLRFVYYWCTFMPLARGTAGGWGGIIMGGFLFLLWLLVLSIEVVLLLLGATCLQRVFFYALTFKRIVRSSKVYGVIII